MIRRGVVDGLLVGLALVLVALYPLFTLYVYPRVLGTAWPTVSHPVRVALLVVSAVAGVLVLGLLGSLVAVRSGTRCPGQGFKTGAVSGLVAALVVYIFLLSPTYELAAATRLWSIRPTPEVPIPPEGEILRFIQTIMRGSISQLALWLLAGAVLGGLEGAFFGLLHRHTPAPADSLIKVVNSVEPRERWYADADGAWTAGIAAGLAGGIVLWLWINASVLSVIQETWPRLQAFMSTQGNVLIRSLSNVQVQNCLSPFLLVAIFGTGGLAVLLLKDPPRRHLSRLQSVLIAGVAATLPTYLALAQALRSISAVGRYYAFESMQALHAVPGVGLVGPGGELVFDPGGAAIVHSYVYSPGLSLPLFYLVPLGLLAVLLIFAMAWFAPQAALYGLVLPLVFRRPVDRAGRIARGVNPDPASLLPRLYRLFAQDPQTLRVLPHLAFLMKDPAARQVVAAYHTLSTLPGQVEATVPIIRETLVEQSTWRWRVEVGELYRVLEEGLAVKTLGQVRAIKPPPQEVTSSLPVVLAKSCEALGRIMGELAKMERVDDLGTKIIFLNSAQAALLELRRYIDEDGEVCRSCATLYPEIGLLDTLLDRWQETIVSSMKDLQGRANLHATLKIRRAAFAPKLCACLVISNQGLNVAENVRLRLSDGEGYQVLETAEQQIDILSPQDSRELEFRLAPDAPRRLRLSWEMTYDDAVDTGRRVTIADAIDLDQEQPTRPFERIFPIPYVTGTPLRSGEMFVGRQDVFDFVCDHLLGTYQNNVIVLHGQRRTGKTSILYRLQKVLADTHIAVLVDMQGKSARGMADFLYALSDDIVYTLEGHGIFVDLPDRTEYEANPEFTFRSRFLRSVVGVLDRSGNPQQTARDAQAGLQPVAARDVNLLLMFDEFEELQERVQEGRLEPEVFAFLRNLMQHEPRVDFIFSGTHKLEELCADYWSILFNIAVYKRITFLSPQDVDHLIRDPVRAYGLDYDPLAVERIIQVTAGHPYFTQVVCHEMVSFHNETRRSYLTATCVDQALERIVERGEAHFKYIWSGASPDEQKVLLAATDVLPDTDAGATPAQLACELEHKGYALAEDALLGALAHLQARDILTRSGPQSSLYRFKIDLIRRWIGISRPAIVA